MSKAAEVMQTWPEVENVLYTFGIHQDAKVKAKLGSMVAEHRNERERYSEDQVWDIVTLLYACLRANTRNVQALANQAIYKVFDSENERLTKSETSYG